MRKQMNKICTLLAAICLMAGACFFANGKVEKVNADNGTAPIALAGYTVAADEKNDLFRYVNYVKTENAVQTQSFYYGEAKLKQAKNVRLVEYSRMNEDGTFLLTNVMNLAKSYEETTGNKVLAAVNGTFYNPMKPTPQDPLLPWFSFVKDQELVKQGMHLEGWMIPDNGIGWNDEGKVVTGGISTRNVNLQLDDGTTKTLYEINYNRKPGVGDIAVYDKGTFGVKSGFTAYKVAIDKTFNRSAYDANYVKSYFVSKYGSELTKCSDATITVGKNEFYILVETNSDTEKAFTEFKGNFKVIPTAGGDFTGIDYFCGANHTLVKDNEVVPAFAGSSHETSYAPRTTVGFKEDGTAFLLIADGRQKGHATGLQIAPAAGTASKYLTQGELAKALQAKTAVEFDGGGSSTFIIRNNEELKVMNKPSDGSLRKVLNAVMLIEVKGESPVDPDPPVPDPPIEKPDEGEDKPKKGCSNSAVASVFALSGALFICLIKIKR